MPEGYDIYDAAEDVPGSRCTRRVDSVGLSLRADIARASDLAASPTDVQYLNGAAIADFHGVASEEALELLDSMPASIALGAPKLKEDYTVRDGEFRVVGVRDNTRGGLMRCIDRCFPFLDRVKRREALDKHINARFVLNMLAQIVRIIAADGLSQNPVQLEGYLVTMERQLNGLTGQALVDRLIAIRKHLGTLPIVDFTEILPPRVGEQAIVEGRYGYDALRQLMIARHNRVEPIVRNTKLLLAYDAKFNGAPLPTVTICKPSPLGLYAIPALNVMN